MKLVLLVTFFLVLAGLNIARAQFSGLFIPNRTAPPLSMAPTACNVLGNLAGNLYNVSGTNSFKVSC